MCSCPPCAPHWGPGLQPRHVPQLGIEQRTPCFTVRLSILWATPARADKQFFYRMNFIVGNNKNLKLLSLCVNQSSSKVRDKSNVTHEILLGNILIIPCIILSCVLYNTCTCFVPEKTINHLSLSPKPRAKPSVGAELLSRDRGQQSAQTGSQCLKCVLLESVTL